MKSFWGKVKKGQSRGKDLGFPTANTSLHQKIEEGIYLAKVTVHGNVISSEGTHRLVHPEVEKFRSKDAKKDSSTSFRSAQNDKTYNALTFIGAAKTFGETKTQAESYLLDFSGNLYGKYITVQLLKKLRDNKKFTSAEDLKKQMNEDLLNARKFFLEWC